MSFPLNSNQAYIKETGERSTLGKEISGGSTPELPTYSETDAGKVLTVGEDGSLEWDTKGTEAGALVGTDVPSSDLGSEGDYYYRRALSVGWLKKALGDSSTIGRNNIGNEFVMNKAGTITKVKIKCGSNKSGVIKIGNTTAASETSETVSLTANEWFTYTLSTPYEVAIDDHVIIQFVSSSSTGDVYYATNLCYDSDIADWVRSREGSYPGSESGSYSNYKMDIDFEFTNDYYQVIAQYVKGESTWAQI